MGADLIFTAISFYKEMELSERLSLLKKGITQEKDINEWQDYVEWRLGDVTDIKEIHKSAIEDAEEFFRSLNYRDVTYLCTHFSITYITGGMSWGEDPTQSTDIFEAISRFPDTVLKKANMSDRLSVHELILMSDDISERIKKIVREEMVVENI